MAIFSNLLHSSGQMGLQLLIGNRLEIVIKASHFHRFFRVVKIGVACTKHGDNLHVLPAQPFQKLQAALSRHLNICQKEIHLLLPQNGLCLRHALRREHLFNPQTLKVNSRQHSLQNIPLVIHQKNCHLSLLLTQLIFRFYFMGFCLV